MKTTWALIKATIQDWFEDQAPRLAAALSYYTIFSLAPLLLIVIAVAGLVFGSDEARDAILTQAKSLVGETGAAAVGQVLQNASKPASGIFSAILGFILLLFGATGVVGQLQDALNTVWEVESKPGSWIKKLINDRILSLGMILGIGFLLLVSLVISAAVSGLSQVWGASTTFLLEGAHFLVSVGVITVLFAMIFKFLPDVKVLWRNVWVGAFVTALLFTLGKTLMGIYLAQSSIASSYGAAGSVVILLLWVYYSSCILFLGAEFTQVYTQYRGGKMQTKQPSLDKDLETPEIDFALNKIEPGNESRTALLGLAHYSGYQAARLEQAIKPAAEDVGKKLTISKWVYRIVKLIGVKTSAKLAWKGYKIKNKVDELTKPEDLQKDVESRHSSTTA